MTSRFIAAIGLVFCFLSFASAEDAARVVQAPLVDGEIVVDGKLDEAAWKEGPWTSGFVVFSSDTPAEHQTKVAVRHDNTMLYLAAVAEEPEPGKLETDYTPTNGANLWGDDVLEFMVDPIGKQAEYVHVLVQPKGFYESGWVAQGGELKDYAWNTAGQVAAKVTDTGWQAEVAIPLAELNLTEASLAGDFHVMVCRVQRAGRSKPVLSTLGPMSGTFHQPRSFLPLKLDKPALGDLLWRVDGPGDAEVLSVDGALMYRAQAIVTNNSDRQRWVDIRGSLKVGEETTHYTAIEKVPAGQSRTMELLIPCPRLGEGKLVLAVLWGGQKKPLALQTRTVDLEHAPLTVRVDSPFYRNNIYATENLSQIELTARLAMSDEQAKGAKLSASLTAAGSDKPLSTGTATLEGREEKLHLPVEDLPLGRYTLAVTCTGATDEPVTVTQTIRKLPRVAHEWRVDENLALLHNGKPFLPYGWFAWDHIRQDPQADGVTAVYCYHQSSWPRQEHLAWLDQLYADGVFAIVDAWPKSLYRKNYHEPLSKEEEAQLREWIRSLRDHPAVMAWYMYDEPEYRPVLIERAIRAYEVIAEEDPYHPCIMLNMRNDAVARYAPAADILMPDCYPIFNTKRSIGAGIGKITTMMQTCQAASGGRKPWWLVPMAFEWSELDPNARPPTFLELRNQQLQAFIGGARGIEWYVHSPREEWTDLDLGVPFLGREAAALKAAILAPEQPADAVTVEAPGKAPIRATLRKADGHWYVLAVYTDGKPLDGPVTFTVPGLPDGPIYVVSENRTVNASDGRFTDSFGPFAGHVYTTNPSFKHGQTVAAVQARIDAVDKALANPANLADWRKGATLTFSSRLGWGAKPRQVLNARGERSLRDNTRGQWPDWFQVNLPKKTAVGRVAIFGHNFGEYEILVRKGEDWTKVAEGRANPVTPLVVTFEPNETDAVRLVVKSVSEGDRSQFTRFEVFAE
jgi:hypothetical protein